jgi:hypothetical protein
MYKAIRNAVSIKEYTACKYWAVGPRQSDRNNGGAAAAADDYNP